MKSVMKWAALAGVAVMMAAVPAKAQDTLKFAVAAEPYPPFASKNASGKWEGFEVDLVNAICAEIKAKCDVVEQAWDGIIPALTAKKFDVIFASMSITEERQKTIDFSIPYYNTPAAWAMSKSFKGQLTPEGLKGKVIGVQTSTIHADFVDKYYKKGSTVKLYDTQDAANSDLAAGRIDAALADYSALEAFLTSDAGKCCEVKGYAPKDPIFGEGVGAGIRKGETALKKKIDDGIRAIYKNGTFDKLQKKYFAYDVSTPPKN